MYRTGFKLTKHPVQPVKKIKLRNWLIFTVCHVLERFRNFSSYAKFPSNVKTRGSVSFFFYDCLYLLLPGCDVALLLKESNRVTPTLLSCNSSSSIFSFLTFLINRHTRKICFYYHFIYNFLAFNHSEINTG